MAEAYPEIGSDGTVEGTTQVAGTLFSTRAVAGVNDETHSMRLCTSKIPPAPDQCGLSDDVITRFREMESETLFRIARDSCTKHDPFDLCRTRRHEEVTSHHFQYKVTPEVGPVVDQLQCGRCWAYSIFNAMRIPLAVKLSVSQFEFSCNHLFFWHMMERMNYLLHAYVDTARCGEELTGRTVNVLTQMCTSEGGDFYKFRNIVAKYGCMPKSPFPESWTSKYTENCKKLLANKMRTWCVKLRQMVESKEADIEIQDAIKKYMSDVFRILSICTGTPPETFTWEYHDKNGDLRTIGPMSPRQFYEDHVKPVFNLDEKVLLINDVRPGRELGRLYTHEYACNMVGGTPNLAVNTAMHVIKMAARASIVANEAVYFGANHKRHCTFWTIGALDLDSHNFEDFFGTEFYTMSKSERIDTNDSSNSHAMLMTGLSEDADGNPTRWRVENCWGSKGGDGGNYVMTDDWFTEHVFQIVVDRKFVPEAERRVLEQEPIVLPVWDEGKF